LPRASVVQPAKAITAATRRHQNHQQQSPPSTQHSYQPQPRYAPPTPTPPLPDLTRHQSATLIRLTQPPSPQTQRHCPATPHSSSESLQQSHHRQPPYINQDQGMSIPHRSSRTATLPLIPPSPDLPSQLTVSTPNSRSQQPKETREDVSRSGYALESRCSRLSRQRPRPKEPEVQDEEIIDDSELLGAILDGIGRMAVGTVAMQMDEAGRWRIRRDSGGEST
ncbi:hypothetical protein CI238_06741, partial [Colletotrichum incanum]